MIDNRNSETNIDTPGHISDIERWAAEMGERDPLAARALIVGWSYFAPDAPTVEKLTWGQVSPKWTRSIWFKARKAYAEFKKQPNMELQFEEPTRMPRVRDNGEDSLPF